MNNSRFFHSIFQMQYVARWHEHAPRFKDNAASHSFRCAALAILVGIIEEQQFNHSVDQLQLVARALLHDLNETITGSIKHITKKDPHVKHHIKQLEQEVSAELVQSLSRSLQPAFYDYIVNAEDDSYVGKLIADIDTLDALLFCKREHDAGSNPYFSTTLHSLYEQLKQDASESVIWLLDELFPEHPSKQPFQPTTGVALFVHYMMNLDLIQRWSGSFNIIPDNDATHSFRTAAIALFNSTLETERFQVTSIDHYQLLSRALLHDIVEAVSGDVASPIKKSSQQIKLAFEQYERHLASQMVDQLPSMFRTKLTDFIVHAKDDSYEGHMVDIADKVDALIKSNLEMRNNPHYTNIYYTQLTHLQHHYEQPSVIFFLAYILHDITYDHFSK
ncbi:YfbR-like 5'-deoxynucleotidase [Paenibacillus yanchengensis]|uniref:YfbR-like 5'-deoxynucleotidase n=1 Tax=Paenibacillus yanchengensis TaxID=2035833 RepID=A0ABW4YQB9_9BACL